MIRVLILFSILAVSTQMPKLLVAEEVFFETTSCDSCGECSCGGCDSHHGLFADNLLCRDRLFGDVFDDGVGMLGWMRFFHEIHGKPGWFAVFVGGATREYTSTDPNDFLLVPGEGLVSTSQKMPISVAPYGSQVLWQDGCNKNRKINLVAAATIADDNPSFSNWTAFSKLEAFGLQRSRPGDRMGVAGWYNGISPNIKNITAAVPGGLAARDNWGMELYYNREMTPWFHLTGDMQILQNSNATTDTSLVLGMRAIIDL